MKLYTSKTRIGIELFDSTITHHSLRLAKFFPSFMYFYVGITLIPKVKYDKFQYDGYHYSFLILFIQIEYGKYY